MFGRFLTPAVLAALAGLATGGPAAAQLVVGFGGGYRVESWGYYGRYPYPPAVGSRALYSPGQPWVTYYDPRLGWVDGPLQPKVLYSGAPLLTPEGPYTPRSITVFPDDRRPAPALAPAPPAAPYQTARPSPPPAAPVPADTFRYDGGPARPIPDVVPDRAPPPPPPAKLDKPVAPKVPELPTAPAVPKSPEPPPPAGLPKLGPSPMDLLPPPTPKD